MNQKYLLNQLELIKNELTTISLYDRLNDSEKRKRYKELEKEEMKISKKLYFNK